MNLRFIGAAFPRTGTMSIKTAVERLIPECKCYHMHELFFCPDHVPLWDSAWEGHNPDWAELLSPYSGTLDGPACIYWQQLAEAFPNLPVFLTLRDPEEWWESVNATIYQINSKPVDQLEPSVLMVKRTFFDGFLEGRFEDRPYVTDRYRQYCDDVREGVPSDRLVEYRVTDGWEPLCEMLGVAVPDASFPARNTREAFLERQRKV